MRPSSPPSGTRTAWLPIYAFVLAVAVTRSGLAGGAAVLLVGGARPSASGAAEHGRTRITSFAGPGELGPGRPRRHGDMALAADMRERARLVVMPALLFPTVMLLSDIATLIGAGAHLITVGCSVNRPRGAGHRAVASCSGCR
ncbi:Anion permease OS=Streptomyces microflavus OX=1919 GN=HUT09_25430 PE=4 SV=1 [Streptomyces microflavus]